MGKTRERNLHLLATALFFWASTSLAAGFKIRLHGTIRCSGKLEIKQRGAWLSVCLDNLTLNAAQVVCKELGCGAALGVYNMSSAANETEKIHLICPDGEKPFHECFQLGRCSRYGDDAAVECSEPLLPLMALAIAGALLLLLLLLLLSLALCLVCRKRRAKRRIPTRFVSRVKNEYESDNDEGDEDEGDYVNVEPVVTVSYVKTPASAAAAKEGDGDDYEELDSDEDHNYEEATPGEGFAPAAAAHSDAESSTEGEDSSDDEGDYENVLMPLSETKVHTFWKEEDIYQNL